MDHWMTDIISGIGGFFLHPLTYVGLLVMTWVGVRRVKRERKMFHTAASPVAADVFHRLLPGMLAGLGLSVVAVVAGIVLTPDFIFITALVYFLLLLVGGTRFASAAYALGLALLISRLIPIEGVRPPEPLPVLILIAAFLIAEGICMYRQARHTQFSPIRLRSKRGKWIGGQRLDRMWLMPVCLFVPGDVFSASAWWPLLPITGEVSLLIVPFLVGFRLTVIGQLMGLKIKGAGTRVVALGVLMGAGIAVYLSLDEWAWIPLVLIVILGRMLLQLYEYVSDRRNPHYFIPKNDGIVILAVLPGSPAEKMGLLPGEIVTKVHGTPVNTVWGFYQQLQINSAYGRVEVMDTNKERRVEQAALFDNQHHELGLLLLHSDDANEMPGQVS